MLLVACAGPPVTVDHPLVTVRAPEGRDAAFVSWVVHRHGPSIAAILDVEQTSLEVEVVRGRCLSHSSRMYGGYLSDGTIIVSEGALEDYGHKVAHEIVHAYLDGVAWHENLPVYLQEGVAEFASLYATGEYGLHKRFLDDMTLDPEDPYVLGFRAVDRVGLKALIELAKQGPVEDADLQSLPTAEYHEHLLPD